MSFLTFLCKRASRASLVFALIVAVPVRAEQNVTQPLGAAQNPPPLEFMDWAKLQEKPYSIALDVLRMICVKISLDPKALELSKELPLGLNPYNCKILLEGQSSLLRSDPQFLKTIVVSTLADSLTSVDYNLSLMQLNQIFAQASTTLFPPRPQLIWESLDEVLREVHEKNWSQTTELRLDRESRVGTVAGHAFYFAQVSATGIFVFRLGRGFLQGIQGTRYLSASMRGLAYRSGEHLKYFLNRKQGWEKARYQKNRFQDEGVGYDYHFKVAGGSGQVLLPKTITRSTEVKTYSQIQKEFEEVEGFLQDLNMRKDNLAFVDKQKAYYDAQRLLLKRALDLVQNKEAQAQSVVQEIVYELKLLGDSSVSFSRLGSSSKGRVSKETVFERHSLLEAQNKLSNLELEQFNDMTLMRSLTERSLRTGENPAEIQRSLAQVTQTLKERGELIASYQKAISNGQGVPPEHLKELVFRREVLGSTEEELWAFAESKGMVLTEADRVFLSHVKPRSYFDRLLSQEEKTGSLAVKMRRYVFGREALSIYLGAGLGAYVGAKYHQKLYERDITAFRDSALQSLGQSYESALAQLESNLESDLKESENILELLKRIEQNQDYSVLAELAKVEGLKNGVEALTYFSSEAQQLMDSEQTFRDALSWLSKNYRASSKDLSPNPVDESLGEIFFNPERVQGLHDSLLRNAALIGKLSVELVARSPQEAKASFPE